MSVDLAAQRTTDAVLGRLLAAAWPALPALAMAGFVSVAAATVSSWSLGPANPWTPLIAGVLTAPAALWAVDGLHAAAFDVPPQRTWRRGRLIRAELLVAVVTGLASWSLLAATAAEASRGVLFQVLAVAGVILAVLAALVCSVALPVGALRGEIRLATVVRFALYATLRRPVGPLSALLTGGAVAWLGLTWFSGLLFLAVPVFLLVGVVSAWPTAAASGLVLPDLLPTPSDHRPQGAP